jgi:hypothetical protein
MRIICQCNKADFIEIENMAASLDDPSKFDQNALSKKQKWAFHFIIIAMKHGISWELMRSVVREVLFWGDEEAAKRLEIRFARDPAKKGEIEEFKTLWK